MARKKKPQAQLRFCEKNGREGYAINILSNGTWGLDSWYPLVESKEHSSGETDYVHYSILRKLADLQEMGYEIDLRI